MNGPAIVCLLLSVALLEEIRIHYVSRNTAPHFMFHTVQMNGFHMEVMVQNAKPINVSGVYQV